MLYKAHAGVLGCNAVWTPQKTNIDIFTAIRNSSVTNIHSSGLKMRIGKNYRCVAHFVSLKYILHTPEISFWVSWSLIFYMQCITYILAHLLCKKISYCNVLGGSLFTMELYCTPKVNTLQLNTDSNSWNTRMRPTRTVSERSLLRNSSNRASCGNLPTLTPILAVRELPNARRDNPSSGYRFTCTPQRYLGVYIINLH
jgi:hypothetical protein